MEQITSTSVADPGEGPGEPPSFVGKTEARRAEKISNWGGN